MGWMKVCFAIVKIRCLRVDSFGIVGFIVRELYGNCTGIARGGLHEVCLWSMGEQDGGSGGIREQR